ncbi:hypothetical protein ARMSODRAFT_1018816 [Armillaria solidipes]|uniref:Uncharacterized protein n=1 Tax=Armillaria solidipes TaxID=1076256 RepID=A0A2H3BTN4_9AGAR|nr:hypothetical protein ARMSODRAFT_1018816 [Armillaria solidipes]
MKKGNDVIAASRRLSTNRHKYCPMYFLPIIFNNRSAGDDGWRPLELIGNIVDNDDRDSLVAFHNPTLYHLFETIHLDAAIHQFLSLCDISPVAPSIIRSLNRFQWQAASAFSF